MTTHPPDLDEFAADARRWLSSVAAPRADGASGASARTRSPSSRTGRRSRSAPRPTGSAPTSRRSTTPAGARSPGPRSTAAATCRRRTRWRSGRRRTPSTCRAAPRCSRSPSSSSLRPIAQWGTPEQRERYVRAMLRTDLIACQLFSETEAGLRPRRRPHPGRRARRPLGPRRPQGVDLRRAGRRPRRRGHPHRPGRGQARRPHRLPGADGRSRRHGAADPADDRRQLLQRGLPRRRRALRRPAGSARSARAGRSR